MSKGQFADFFLNFIRLLVVVVLGFILWWELSMFSQMDIPTERIEGQIVAQRILRGPDGIALLEARTGRVLPGTVDVDFLTNQRITAAYNEGFDEQNLWAGRFTLYSTVSDRIASTNPVATAFLDPEGPAQDFFALGRANVRGRGSGQYYHGVYPVQFGREESTTEMGWLVVELVKRT